MKIAARWYFKDLFFFSIQLSPFLYFTNRIALNMELLNSRKNFRFTIVILFYFLSIDISMTFFKFVSTVKKSFLLITKQYPFKVENFVGWKMKNHP